jgi:glycosyltransferase involved in cell wall biosynthesis
MSDRAVGTDPDLSPPSTWHDARQILERHSEEVVSDRLVSAPVVSVAIVAFNHGRFLAQAIESALAQSFDEPFEVVIGDDASADHTWEVATAYQRLHPTKIRLQRSTVNLGRVTRTGMFNHLRTFMACRGEFVAECQGDDYWTDPDKLRRQVAHLRQKPSASACFHDCVTVDENDARSDDAFHAARPRWKPEHDRRDCMTLRSNYPTASLMFRRSVFDGPIPDYLVDAYSDHSLDIHVTASGTLDYLPFVGCAYRVHPGGIWQGTSRTGRAFIALRRIDAFARDPELGARFGEDLFEERQQLLRRVWADGRWGSIPVLRSMNLHFRLAGQNVEAPTLRAMLGWELKSIRRRLRRKPS